MKGILAALLLSVAPLGAAEPVWIDTDPSMAPGGHEIDDGFALLQAFHSPELAIRGISVVFGNAPLPDALRIGREFVARFGPMGMPVYQGAASGRPAGQETEASRALTEALRREVLTVFVLGPATNLATVLQQHPELRSRIRQIVAVAGRRPQQRFVVGDKKHRPFRDFNFEMDPPAFQTLLDSGVPLVLAPWEISSQVWLTTADLEKLRTAHDALAWLYQPAMDWMAGWRAFGVDGFNPFDTLAIAYVTSPRLLQCEPLPAEIRTLPDDTVLPGESARPPKPYLLVAREIRSRRTVNYCFRPALTYKADLLRRLTAAK